MTLRIDVLTLFPAFFDSPLRESLLGRAIREELVDVRVSDIRDHAHDRHRQVDDASFGGGPGMVMKPEPVFEAVESLGSGDKRVVLLTPAGRPLDQSLAARSPRRRGSFWSAGGTRGWTSAWCDPAGRRGLHRGLRAVRGRGRRARDPRCRHPAGARRGRQRGVPGGGVVRGPGLLDHPQYTRPREFRGLDVPEVLLSGDHAGSRHGAARPRSRRPAETDPTCCEPPDPRAAVAAGRRRCPVLSWAAATPRQRIAGIRVMNKIDLVEKPRLRETCPTFVPGDTVRVHVRVAEAGRERIQVFQGVVIRRQGGGLRETFTVRKMSFGVGVERTFPLHSPTISKIEVVTAGRVRRAKLYYLRERRGKRGPHPGAREPIPARQAPAAGRGSRSRSRAERVVGSVDRRRRSEAGPSHGTSTPDPRSRQTRQPSRRAGRQRADPSRSPTRSEKNASGLAFLRELPVLLLIAFLLALLIKTFLVQAFYIPSESMEPTLKVGDRVLVNKVVYHLHPPRRGDIIVFSDPHPSRRAAPQPAVGVLALADRGAGRAHHTRQGLHQAGDRAPRGDGGDAPMASSTSTGKPSPSPT